MEAICQDYVAVLTAQLLFETHDRTPGRSVAADGESSPARHNRLPRRFVVVRGEMRAGMRIESSVSLRQRRV